MDHSRRHPMLKQSARKAGSFLTIFALGVGFLTAIPSVVHGQASDDSKKQQVQDKKDKKPAASKTTAAPAATSKALSTSEDPSQIGKRKINNGADKLFGW